MILLKERGGGAGKKKISGKSVAERREDLKKKARKG